MENVIVERKTMLELRKQLPPRIDYASLVLERLHKNGITCYNKMKIYGMVSGRQKPKLDVFNAMIEVVSELKKRTVKVIIE